MLPPIKSPIDAARGQAMRSHRIGIAFAEIAEIPLPDANPMLSRT